MTAPLTDNLPLLAGAPNGIKKLRELILALAVRGKLVPQDPSDEPANELLKRVAEEKTRLVDEGKIKKQKLLATISDEEKSFDLPVGWAWQRFGEIFTLEYGDNLPADKRSNTGEYPVYGSNGIVGTHSKCFVSSPCIVVGRKGSAGALNLCLAKGCCVTDVAYYCIPPSACLLDYVFKLFHTLGLDSLGKGIKPGLNRNEAYELVVAVPPLSEQRRIVAKVDELMSLCDRLEAQQDDTKSAHAQLVQALLDSLIQTSDATDFAANWQRLAEHFHTMFTTESSIDTLKQTLLQLAVMGKLVPQDPNDEPASEFVKRIQAEKQRYCVASKTRKQKELAADSEPEPPFEAPASWEWKNIDDVLHVTGGVALGRKLGGRKLVSKPYLRVANVQRGHLQMGQIKEVEVPEDEVEKYLLRNGDLLITEGGDWDKVGRTAIWRDELSECLHQNHVFRARAVVSDWEPRWAEMYLNSTSAREYFAGSSKQTTNLASINMTQLRACAFPLPPLGEQQRIVAKVDQLMVLCDQLKTRLTQARQLNEQLASTLVERALAGDGQQTPVTMDQKAARTLLAAEITHRLHAQRTFGQRKLQKVIYLAEHAARLATIQGSYLRNVAGPHDRQLMNQVEGELQTHQWYERIERETVGHAYRPLSQAGQHQQAYKSAWSGAERVTIEQVIELMRDWDTDRCEMTVTLYAAWNDFILEGRPVIDEAIVDEVMHSWNDAKLRFGKDEWLAVLAEMKKHELLIPTGFGQRTTGGMLSLPGFG